MFLGGLGQLTDGVFAGDDESWLVWKTSPVTIRFHFERVYQFHLIRIYSVHHQYRSVKIHFGRSVSIQPRRLTMDRSSSVFVDTIVLSDYGDVSMFIGEELLIQIEFDESFLSLTEITFDNEVTFLSPNASRCVKREKSSLHWLISFSVALSFFVLFCLLGRFCLRKKSVDPPEPTTTEMEKRNTYDDIISLGSYIYPITAATSLLQSSSPSSLDHYAVIDSQSSSSSICCSFSRHSSLFNCVLPEEFLPSKSTFTLPRTVDPSQLTCLSLLSRSKFGEIFSGTLSISQSVLIKMVHVKFLDVHRERFLGELNLVSRLKNEHLARVCAVDLERLCLVQEYSELGTVHDYFHRRDNIDDRPGRNLFFAYQLADALEYLANAHLIHNDVAARNCLFYADYSLKLTDCAKAFEQFDREYYRTNHGEKIPLRWIAPEVLTVSTRNSIR